MLRVSYGHFSLFLVHSLPSACLTSTRQRPRVVVGPDIILSYPRTMCIALEKGAAISAQNDTTVWISPRNSTLHIFFSFELPLCGTSDCPIAIATLHPDSHLIFLPFSLPLSRSLSLSLSWFLVLVPPACLVCTLTSLKVLSARKCYERDFMRALHLRSLPSNCCDCRTRAFYERKLSTFLDLPEIEYLR